MAYNPPIGSIYHLYTTYILPSGGLYATYHLLGEPETTIDEMFEAPERLVERAMSINALQESQRPSWEDGRPIYIYTHRSPRSVVVGVGVVVVVV